MIGNTAVIGGAMRLITLIQNHWETYSIACNFLGNKAEIFGDNIGTYPTSF